MTDLLNQNSEEQVASVQSIESMIVKSTAPTQPTQTKQPAWTPKMKHKSFWDFQLNLLKAIFTDWNFKRRISAREYQYLFVTLLILQFAVLFLGQYLASIFSIFSLVVSVKVWIWRMRDINRSPWLLLLLLIPIVNIIVIIFLLFKSGTKWPNKYGEDVINDYKKLGGVKRYYGLIQALIFFGLLAIVFLPMIGMFALLLWISSHLPVSEIMNNMQQLTWTFNVIFSGADIFMSGGMNSGTGF